MIIAALHRMNHWEIYNLPENHLSFFALDQTRAEQGAAAISIFEHAM
jgi:hypothetical protein